MVAGSMLGEEASMVAGSMSGEEAWRGLMAVFSSR
jgi:hypothetical protein